MVAENDHTPFDVEDSKAGNIRHCLRQIDMWSSDRKLSPVDFKRNLENLQAAFLAVRGISIAEASKDCLNPIDRLENTDILEMGEKALKQLRDTIQPLVGLDLQKKNRWLDLIDGVIEIQSLARMSAVAMWCYVGRTSETNAIFEMAPVHLGYFEIWAGDSANSLIMAPPGHGKTTSLRGQILWDICNNPNRRILICYDTDDKAQKEVNLLKRYINSGRLRALYPEIYVLDRKDGAQNSSKRFTVNRPNIGSREPSIECAGIMSKVNGNGYDEIVIDDPCPETVATQPASRIAINVKFNTVLEERFRDPKTSRLLMICTPWHVDDLAGMIQKDCRNGKRSGWKIEVDRFAIKEDGEGGYISIWPDRYTSEYYKGKRLKMTNNEFARLYQLRCISDEERIVKHLHYYPALGDRDPLWKSLPASLQDQYSKRLNEIAKGEIWLSVDPSATDGKASSDTGITKFSLTQRGEAYIVDTWLKPGNPLETQDWLVDQIINHGVHRLLIEAQGGMTGMVVLWTAYIMRRLRELDFKWNGSIVDCKTQGHGSGQNIGKTRRLQNSAAYLENGYVLFPGKLFQVPGAGNFKFIRGNQDRIVTLEQQIFDFPSGTCDGVDSVTQWINEVESRLPPLSEYQQAERSSMAVYEDPMRALLRKQIHDLRNPPKNHDPTGEQKWTTELLGAV
jgi:hypothetical protein